ncbi:cell division protein FtsW [Candidatus Woesebacteria bacterium RIFOXYD1_FULL_41_28]|uniref:Probable peptidoglycan glycosyltransferase FtsW n=1 Tax=Candidatus Woesebacteria bacterium RIFOXYD1_FULL_41_28 TaxID=1802550 RepID=A0A1F8DL18_9BACT|nr:MAG: cell division protein FtsW [Candidatus Woesebacteria bacterium RIFOXYD1_FULL_41_28]
MDQKLFFLVIALVIIGIIAVADVSAPQSLNNYGNKFYLLKEQAISAVIGVGVFFVVSRIKYTFWQKLATPLFFVTIGLLILVLMQRFGLSALGARRWISIGPINFQPSEIVKFAICIYFAKVAASNKSPLSYFIPLALVAGLIMLQPDLGTTLVVLVIGFSQIFVADVNLLYVLGSAGVGVVATTLLILFSPYRKARLMTFLESTGDPLGQSYHIRQILLALGSGGIFGVGFGASRQKYLFLPEASTDSIFAVIAEELGLLGALAIIFLFTFFIIRGLKIAKNAPDRFSSVLAVGISAWIGGQAFLNIGSMVSLVPLTGIPLPFISFGGSSLVMILAACGILLNISKFTKNEQK